MIFAQFSAALSFRVYALSRVRVFGLKFLSDHQSLGFGLNHIQFLALPRDFLKLHSHIFSTCHDPNGRVSAQIMDFPYSKVNSKANH